MRIYYVILVFLLMMPRLNAQQDSIAYYLNDSGLSSFKKVVKTDLTQILKGNLMLMVEKDISGNMRLEYGVGLLTSALINPPLARLYRQGTDFSDETFTKVKMKPGLSLYGSPRYTNIKFSWFYVSTNFLAEYYIGQLFVTDLSCTIGYEFNLSKKMVLDVSTGYGFEMLTSTDDYYYAHVHSLFKIKSFDAKNTISFYIPLSVKLGYRIP